MILPETRRKWIHFTFFFLKKNKFYLTKRDKTPTYRILGKKTLRPTKNLGHLIFFFDLFGNCLSNNCLFLPTTEVVSFLINEELLLDFGRNNEDGAFVTELNVQCSSQGKKINEYSSMSAVVEVWYGITYFEFDIFEVEFFCDVSTNKSTWLIVKDSLRISNAKKKKRTEKWLCRMQIYWR